VEIRHGDLDRLVRPRMTLEMPRVPGGRGFAEDGGAPEDEQREDGLARHVRGKSRRESRVRNSRRADQRQPPQAK
jgi:hypothetical protein